MRTSLQYRLLIKRPKTGETRGVAKLHDQDCTQCKRGKATSDLKSEHLWLELGKLGKAPAVWQHTWPARTVEGGANGANGSAKGELVTYTVKICKCCEFLG